MLALNKPSCSEPDRLAELVPSLRLHTVLTLSGSSGSPEAANTFGLKPDIELIGSPRPIAAGVDLLIE